MLVKTVFEPRFRGGIPFAPDIEVGEDELAAVRAVGENDGTPKAFRRMSMMGLAPAPKEPKSIPLMTSR